MVEQIKRLGAELQFQPFGKGTYPSGAPCRFHNTRVHVQRCVPSSPTCQLAGVAKAAGLNQLLIVCAGRVNGHAGDQVRPLILFVAVGQVRRASGLSGCQSGGRSMADAIPLSCQPPSTFPAAPPSLKKWLAGSKRKLVDRVDREGLANVNVRAAIVTSDARQVLNVRGVARSEPFVSQTVRPHVLRPPQPSTGESALQGYLKRVEVAVAEVIFVADTGQMWVWGAGPLMDR